MHSQEGRSFKLTKPGWMTLSAEFCLYYLANERGEASKKGTKLRVYKCHYGPQDTIPCSRRITEVTVRNKKSSFESIKKHDICRHAAYISRPCHA